MIIYIFYSLCFAIFVYNFLKIIHKLKSTKDETRSLTQKYFFLFPVLEEQVIVSSTIKYLSELLKENIDANFIFIVSPNEQERLLKKGLNTDTTEIILKEELSKNLSVNERSIIIGEHDNPRETKASKINFAIQYIRKNYSIQEYIIGIFDFDGRININDYYKIDDFITHNQDIKVFSTIPLPALSNSNFIGYSSGFYQLERVFFKEFLGKNEYCMGAGMFIRGDFFLENTLPNFNDDIALGYKLLLKNILKNNVNIFTHVTIPKKSIGNIKQLIPIYKAVFSYFEIMRLEKNISIRNIFNGIFIIGKDIFDILETILFIVTFFLDIKITIFIMIYYIIKSYLVYCLYRKTTIKSLNIIQIPIYYIIGKLLKLFSFIYFIAYIIKYKNIYGIKTER